MRISKSVMKVAARALKANIVQTLPYLLSFKEKMKVGLNFFGNKFMSKQFPVFVPEFVRKALDNLSDKLFLPVESPNNNYFSKFNDIAVRWVYAMCVVF